MSEEKNLEALMGLIIHAGNGKSDAYEAISFAKEGDFKAAEDKLEAASQSLIEAHHAQTAMLTEEAKGNHAVVTLLMVHSQDHLMTAMTFMDLAREIVDLYKKIQV